jgi:Fe-S-cluster containining protein
MTKVRASDAKYRHIGSGMYAKIIDVKPEDSFRFDCLRCGTCCSRPPGINPKEASRIAEYLGISKIDFFNDYVILMEDPFYGWKAKLDMRGDYCVFREKGDGKASCKIHEVSPRQCRAKPIAGLGRDPTKSGLEAIRLGFQPCSGFGRGREYTVKEWIEMNGLEKAWQEESEYVKKIRSIRRTTNRLMTEIIDAFVLES